MPQVQSIHFESHKNIHYIQLRNEKTYKDKEETKDRNETGNPREISKIERWSWDSRVNELLLREEDEQINIESASVAFGAFIAR